MFFCGNIQPVATAELKGISKYPTVRGTVNFTIRMEVPFWFCRLREFPMRLRKTVVDF